MLCTCFFLVGASTLAQLLLNDNMIRGSVPTDLARVMSFNARGNALTGSIPAAVGRLSSLICVFLFANRLSGSIPAILGQLRSLRVVGLGENSLTGAVPDCFCSCKDLQGLLLDNSMLEGTLPSSLTQLRRLSHLDLSAGRAQRAARRVHFQGSIPDLSCPLEESDLYRNGPLLLLHGQKFEGRLGHMSSSFLVLTIHENRFEGMPTIVNCRNGGRVTVHRNWLSCGIPTLKCSSGERLDLSLVGIGNFFFNPKGSFPSWIMPFERSSLLWASRTEGLVFLVQTCMGGLSVLLSFRFRVAKRGAVDAIARIAAYRNGAAFLKICCDTCLHAGCQCILAGAVILVTLSSDFPSCPASLRRLSTLLMWDRWVLVTISISWWCWCRHMFLPWLTAPRIGPHDCSESGLDTPLWRFLVRAFAWLASLCWSLLVLPLSLPALLQLVATCVPDFLGHIGPWSRILRTAAGTLQGLINSIAVPWLAKLIGGQELPLSRHAWESGVCLFLSCVMPCCIVFIMDGACLAHWTRWWTPCQKHANIFRVSTPEAGFTVEVWPRIAKIHVPEKGVMNEDDICLPASDMLLSMCARSMLGKVQLLIIGKLSSQAVSDLNCSDFEAGMANDCIRNSISLRLRRRPRKTILWTLDPPVWCGWQSASELLHEAGNPRQCILTTRFGSDF